MLGTCTCLKRFGDVSDRHHLRNLPSVSGVEPLKSSLQGAQLLDEDLRHQKSGGSMAGERGPGPSERQLSRSPDGLDHVGDLLLDNPRKKKPLLWAFEFSQCCCIKSIAAVRSSKPVQPQPGVRPHPSPAMHSDRTDNVTRATRPRSPSCRHPSEALGADALPPHRPSASQQLSHNQVCASAVSHRLGWMGNTYRG